MKVKSVLTVNVGYGRWRAVHEFGLLRKHDQAWSSIPSILICDPVWEQLVLSPMSVDSIFHPEHKATWINYLISQSKSARFEWSGFAGCFSQAQWWFRTCGVGPNGAPVSQGMAVCGCTALWCSINTISFCFSQFWDLTWPSSSLRLPFQFSWTASFPPSEPPPPSPFGARLIQSTLVQKLFKMGENLVVGYLHSGCSGR